MSFKHAPRGLKDEGLRGVESGKIGGPSRVVGQTDSHHCVGAFENFVRLFEEQGSFRLHKSPASQVNAVGADLMHQRRAVVVGTGAVGHGVNELAGFVENGGAEVGQPV